MQKGQDRQSVILSDENITTVTIETGTRDTPDIAPAVTKRTKTSTGLGDITEKDRTALPFQDHAVLHHEGREGRLPPIEDGVHIRLIEGSAHDPLTVARRTTGKFERCKAGTLLTDGDILVHVHLPDSNIAPPLPTMTEPPNWQPCSRQPQIWTKIEKDGLPQLLQKTKRTQKRMMHLVLEMRDLGEELPLSKG